MTPGRLANSDTTGEFVGRRFVGISREGAVTVVETIDSHEDDSLDGRFEFGARLPLGWDQD